MAQFYQYSLWPVGKFWGKIQVSKIFKQKFLTETFKLKYSKENIS